MKISKQMEDDLRRWNQPVYLTPEGFIKLKAKLERLQKSVPGLVSEAARTAAYGDRSENFEYKDAKGRLRRTYRQIASIEDQMKRISIIKPEKINGRNVIQLGSEVIIETDSGQQRRFQILGPQESSPADGKISHESPLGKALMGKSENEEVLIQAGAGAGAGAEAKNQNGVKAKRYKIIKVI